MNRNTFSEVFLGLRCDIVIETALLLKEIAGLLKNPCCSRGHPVSSLHGGLSPGLIRSEGQGVGGRGLPVHVTCLYYRFKTSSNYRGHMGTRPS